MNMKSYILVLGFGRFASGPLFRVLDSNIRKDINIIYCCRVSTAWEPLMGQQELELIHDYGQAGKNSYQLSIVNSENESDFNQLMQRKLTRHTIVVTNNLSVRSMLINHAQVIFTCVKKGFPEVMQEICQLRESPVDVFPLENDFLLVEKVARSLKHEFPNIQVKPAIIDCISSQRTISSNSVYVRCEPFGIVRLKCDDSKLKTLISYEEIPSDFKLEELKKVGDVSVKRQEKLYGMNFLHRIVCSYAIYKVTGNLNYSIVKEYADVKIMELWAEDITSFVKALEEPIAHLTKTHVSREEFIDHYECQTEEEAIFEHIKMMSITSDMTLKRIQSNTEDTLGRVINLSSLDEYIVRLRETYDMFMELQKYITSEEFSTIVNSLLRKMENALIDVI